MCAFCLKIEVGRVPVNELKDKSNEEKKLVKLLKLNSGIVPLNLFRLKSVENTFDRVSEAGRDPERELLVSFISVSDGKNRLLDKVPLSLLLVRIKAPRDLIRSTDAGIVPFIDVPMICSRFNVSRLPRELGIVPCTPQRAQKKEAESVLAKPILI